MEAQDRTVDILEHVVEDLTAENRMLAHQKEELLHQNERLSEENQMLVARTRFEPLFKTFAVFRWAGTGLMWLARLCF